MPGAVCPSCGVAVVPGYVRCPKCHAALPQRPSAPFEGGTALEEAPRRFPLVAVIAVAVLGAAVIIFFGLRGGDDKPAPQPAAAAQPEPAEVEAPVAATPAAPAPAVNAPDPGRLADDLQRALRKERLWSTVAVIGARVDIRSASCGDPAMAPLVDAAVPSFKAAGLTKLRCLEQSGRVVTDRDL